MDADLAFLFGLLDARYPAYAAWEDFVGEHGKALRLWQRMGFLAGEPGRHPCPSCPHCREGVPLLLNGRFFCDTCHVMVDARHLCFWQFDLDALLVWLAGSLQLTGDVRRIDDTLWQLGNLLHRDVRFECFFVRRREVGERGRQRLLAYRNAVLLQCLPSAERIEEFSGPRASLLDVLRQDARSLRAADLTPLLDGRKAVRFDDESGGIRVDGICLGEVSVGTKEYFLLACLARQQDHFIAYADLKRFVLEQSGSLDETEEANFCQKLKSRIKKRIPKIDLLIAVTSKGDGYRLRATMQDGSYVA
jgi:DNA-binding winged helix-turn-helix (wHTH) protein